MVPVECELASVDDLMAEASVDDEMMQRMRDLVGVGRRINHSINNEEVTRLAIARFAANVRDTNLLWLDEGTTAKRPYESSAGQPSFVMGAFYGTQFGWPGLSTFHCKSTVDCHQSVYLDDRMTPTCRYEGFAGPRPTKSPTTW